MSPRGERRDDGRGGKRQRSARRLSRVSAWIAVPALVFVLQLLAFSIRRRATEFLLVPPLAVMAYLLFTQPDAPRASFRGAVVLPIASAMIGELSYRLLGLTPWGVAAAVVAVLAAQWLASTAMPPALAIAVLALFLRAQQADYTLDVAAGTALIAGAFFAWRHWLWRRASTP